MLRHAIGAITEADFEAELNELKASMSDYANQVDTFNAEIESIEDMFETWQAMSGSAVVGKAPTSEPVEASSVELVQVVR